MAKKIGAIVSLSIIGILILATIIMANVNVDYSIKCATPSTVWINYNSNDPLRERKVVEDASTIIDYIENASKEKSLTALFNGNLNKKAELCVENSVGKDIPSNTGFYVRYHYDNDQKTKDKNGNTVYYQELVFTVQDSDEETTVKVYVIPDATKAKVYTHYYELDADFSSLYDFLVENEYNI